MTGYLITYTKIGGREDYIIIWAGNMVEAIGQFEKTEHEGARAGETFNYTQHAITKIKLYT